MSLLAINLLFIAGILHAVWNLLLKQLEHKYIIVWLSLVVGSFLFLPLLIFGNIPLLGLWPYALGSAFFQTCYFAALAAAYNKGELSLIYPIARGFAPVFLTFWSLLFLGEYFTDTGAIGLVILIVGLVVVSCCDLFFKHEDTYITLSAIALAFSVSLFISFCSVIDGAAVKITNPSPYTIFVFFLSALFIAPIVLYRYGWVTTKNVWNNYWKKISIIGFCNVLSYIFVLGAYALSKISYAGAIREVNIIFGAIAGWKFLKEGFGRIRTLGAIIIFIGILIIAISR